MSRGQCVRESVLQARCGILYSKKTGGHYAQIVEEAEACQQAKKPAEPT